MHIPAPLIEQCLDNQRDAQKKLYHALLPYLRAIGMRYIKNPSLINDVLQESFVKLFKRMHQYDSKKGRFHKWASRILINTVLTYNDRIDFEYQSFDIQKHDLGHLPEILSVFSDEMVLSFLRKMPFDWYEVFNLHVIDGFNHQEISEFLGISNALSRKRLSRARSWLQEHAVLLNQELLNN